MATTGIYWKDSAANYIRLEYTDDLVSSPLDWNEVVEVKGISANPEAADQIPFTHYGSKRKERRTGLPNDGTYAVTCNYGPTQATHTAIIGLKESGEERYWKITYPLADTGNSNRAQEFFGATVELASIAPPGAEDAAPVDFTFTLLLSGSAYTYTAES